MPDFKLSAVLAGHNSDVRAVALPDPSLAFTASRDGTTRVWKQTSASPPAYEQTESSNGASFKTCLAYASEVKGYPDGIIFSGGQDSIIEARQPGTTSEQNADGLMIGHAHQVCSLDVNIDAGYVVSGSWDKTAKVWQIGSWEAEVELEGHTASCADRGIRVFDLRGKMRISFDGRDIVRALAKLPKGHNSGGDFVAATNDGVIRIWTLKGEERKELIGHEAFIYSLAVLPSGEIVSSGEDRTVRIWDGPACLQVITLPAISVWSVAACPNGDIITGSSDKMARIFTRDDSRRADETTIAQFDELVQSSTIPQQQLGEINKTDAPGPEFLQQKSGTKEGQHQMIKEDDGSIWLYSWSNSQGWDKVGQVVESSASSTKKVHAGKEYDYVFDIDIEDGKPPLKLPFNVTQNPHEAAMKFLQANELPLTYLEETADFIVTNTRGASLGQPSQPVDTGPDAWGSEARYRPDAVSTYQPPARATPAKKLPHKEYLSIVAGKPSAAYGQIVKLNSQYASSGNHQSKLSESELESLSALVKQLEGHKFDGKPSLASTPALEAGLSVAVKVATEWQPPSNRLAGLDLVRFIAAASQQFPKFKVDGSSVVEVIANSGIFDATMLSTNPKLAMIALRFFANLMYGSEQGRNLLEHAHDMIMSKIQPVTPMVNSDIALGVALTTFYLNLAVYNTSPARLSSGETTDRGLTMLGELQMLLSSFPAIDSKLTGNALQQATEPVFRALVALGTTLTGLKDETINEAAKDVYGVPATLDQLKARGLLKEPRFQGLDAEIKAALT